MLIHVVTHIVHATLYNTIHIRHTNMYTHAQTILYYTPHCIYTTTLHIRVWICIYAYSTLYPTLPCITIYIFNNMNIRVFIILYINAIYYTYVHSICIRIYVCIHSYTLLYTYTNIHIHTYSTLATYTLATYLVRLMI